MSLFIYKQAHLANNWKIYSLIEHSIILQATENMYLVIFITPFVVLLFASFFARELADHFNRPLAFVMKEFSQAKSISDFKDIPFESLSEIDSLYHELKRGKQALLQNQEDLQQQVANRTKELNQANKKLNELANTDTLTSLYNRRYLRRHFSIIQSVQ